MKALREEKTSLPTEYSITCSFSARKRKCMCAFLLTSETQIANSMLKYTLVAREKCVIFLSLGEWLLAVAR